jgi:signal transduction histidine kinase
MTPVITLVLAVAVLLVVFALARLTRMIVSIKARLDALERGSHTTPKEASGSRTIMKARSTLSSHQRDWGMGGR